MDVRLLLHHGLCQTRAVALDDRGRPVRLFLQTLFDDHLRLGDKVEAIVSKVSPKDGGCFLRVGGKGDAFLAHRTALDLREGQRLKCRVAAEARTGKLARLVLASDEDQNTGSPLERWQCSLPHALQTPVETGSDIARHIDEVFEDALCPIVALEAGGRLQITPTPALVAIDIDTIGRPTKGRASVRARTVNIEAAEAAGRQIALRDLGGNVVIDCIAPLSKTDGAAVKAAFVRGIREAALRKVSCLAPSPLGMMEASIEHGVRPLGERYCDVAGHPTPLAILLEGLRRLEIEAAAQPANQLIIGLPIAGFKLYQTHRGMIETTLQDRYGGRIGVHESSSNKTEITTR